MVLDFILVSLGVHKFGTKNLTPYLFKKKSMYVFSNKQNFFSGNPNSRHMKIPVSLKSLSLRSFSARQRCDRQCELTHVECVAYPLKRPILQGPSN